MEVYLLSYALVVCAGTALPYVACSVMDGGKHEKFEKVTNPPEIRIPRLCNRH